MNERDKSVLDPWIARATAACGNHWTLRRVISADEEDNGKWIAHAGRLVSKGPTPERAIELLVGQYTGTVTASKGGSVA